jgi:CheY-like chemotaxis protein
MGARAGVEPGDGDGGSVEARSEGLNKGSEFIVRLPLLETNMEPEPPTSRKRAPKHPAAAPLCVLLVDDNEDSLLLMEELVTLWGHDTRRAHDGKEALDIVLGDGKGFDVALIDLGLPIIDGFEVARRLRAAGVRSRLVAVSGYGQPADVERALAAGFDAHLTKPVAIEALRSALRGNGAAEP